MRVETKTTKSFSLDRDVLAEVRRTRGTLSESERVNRLLRAALAREKRAALEREIADFFGSKPTDRAARSAFQAANIESWRETNGGQTRLGPSRVVPQERRSLSVRSR
jgi:Arc/MetJ family transcription regulator